jgi:hypothetical protein
MHRFQRWIPLISAAPSESAVLEVVREYVDVIPSAHLAALPQDCSLRPIKSVDDISDLALTLARCELNTVAREEPPPILHDMVMVLSSAQARIRQLRSPFP